MERQAVEKEQVVDSEAVLGWPEASALETCTEGSVRGGWGEAQNGGRRKQLPAGLTTVWIRTLER